MDFSIIIPALNEGHKIAADVLAASEFLTAHFETGEIIVVDDGSTDNTAEQAEVPMPEHIRLDVIRYEENRGKGYAVRRGILESTGDFIMFADSGLCVPYDNALRGYDRLKNQKCDLAHGSRKRKDSVIVHPHTKIRRLVSLLYINVLKLWLKLPKHITDTQCGFKMYKGDVGRAIYSKCTSNGFTFDIETILRAQKMGYEICEFPIEWTADTDTRLKLTRMPMHILKSFNQLRKELAD